MPVNYEQLRIQMKTAGSVLKLRQDAFTRAADRYAAILHTAAAEDGLKERILNALASRPDFRCAVPKEEPIDTVRPLPPLPPVNIRLLACDGSQITPSRHDEISFGLINTAAVEYITRSGTAPRITTRTELLPFDDLPTEDMVGVRRDAAEKSFLAETAAASAPDIVTFALCDGPLELFSKTPEVREYEQYRAQYHEALVRLAAAKVPAVGYIDRPHSDPIGQMLCLLEGDPAPESKGPGTDDSLIFSRLLGPGERSAVFAINSRSDRQLPEELRTCFFYLNLGRAGHPYISRVEFPAWAAADEQLTELLHALLAEQCRMLGGHPYPFILHRAHECAVVTLAEKEEVKGLLIREMARSGMTIPEKSNKQIAKDLSRI